MSSTLSLLSITSDGREYFEIRMMEYVETQIRPYCVPPRLRKSLAETHCMIRPLFTSYFIFQPCYSRLGPNYVVDTGYFERSLDYVWRATRSSGPTRARI